ncbi:YheC/YheD family protein [Bacillus sp. FJAT-49711]|uniref:YheC/YheD family protein n=1 Tax=Bacillus sp. FJAT-49711 TaxID=2833585 RepID=UPI001BC9D43B|nr:YheC/YheD family protein [Bacillus sp. FJAT-49711]MBS4218265.1 YheC/YheD family protein [Bacillus sp. FJAT-49711]
MFFRINKYYQHKLLSENPSTANFVPETKTYSVKNFKEFLERYTFVFIKHERGGQGKGIFKACKEDNGNYRINGFTLKGETLNVSIASIEDFQYEKYSTGDGLNGAFIIQEGINSITLNGDPLIIRAHIQKLKGRWFVSGMFANISTDETFENGIVNLNRGAHVLEVSELLSKHLGMDEQEKIAFIHTIKRISIDAAKLVALEFPCLEYGIDFGIKSNKVPIIFEVNTFPGVRNFTQIKDKEILKKIYRIRKMQKGEENNKTRRL